VKGVINVTGVLMCVDADLLGPAIVKICYNMMNAVVWRPRQNAALAWSCCTPHLPLAKQDPRVSTACTSPEFRAFTRGPEAT
jgi:hypothetical protein